jgi:hypothetical protein
MKCSCIKDNEKKIAEIYTERLGVPCDVEAKGVAFTLGAKPGMSPFMPFTVKADKPGFRGSKGKEISMFFSFCPWCGVRIDEEERGAA